MPKNVGIKWKCRGIKQKLNKEKFIKPIKEKKMKTTKSDDLMQNDAVFYQLRQIIEKLNRNLIILNRLLIRYICAKLKK